MKDKKKIKYVHAGRYMAEVEVDLIKSKNEWAPYLSVEDATKLDDVKEALQREDLESALKYGRVYRLEPVHQ